MKTSFKQFAKYCRQIEPILNELEGYSAAYKISGNAFLKEHDGQYFEVTFRDNQKFIKMNFMYSIAYQIPTFYFMIYDENSQPLQSLQIYQLYIHKTYEGNQQLHPSNQERGIYLAQNVISKQYFYTLHHCDLSMRINHLIPFYLSLLNLHPPIQYQTK